MSDADGRSQANAAAAAALRARLLGPAPGGCRSVAGSQAAQKRRREEAAAERLRTRAQEGEARRDEELGLGSASYEVDDDGEVAESPTKRTKSGAQGNPAATARWRGSQAAKCELCLDGGRRSSSVRELVVSVGELCYLALPARGSLCQGHCLIVPMEHVWSMRRADDRVLAEVQRFKSCLLEMFHAQGRTVVFVEQSRNAEWHHAALEVVPLPSGGGAEDVRGMFKLALMEAESEWGQQRKIIETKGRPLSSVLPAQMPYFFVDFDGNGGFAHVIDDPSKFPSNFSRVSLSLPFPDTFPPFSSRLTRMLLKSVLASALDLPPESAVGRPRRSSADVERSLVSEFSKLWAPHDRTKTKF